MAPRSDGEQCADPRVVVGRHLTGVEHSPGVENGVAVGQPEGEVDILLHEQDRETFGLAERRYRIFRTDRGFRIEGTPPDDEEELETALRSAGARTGDTVEVSGDTMELQ